MAFEPVHGPTGPGVDVVKDGTTADGKQRLRCQNVPCACTTFLRAYSYPGRLAEVKHQIVEMSLNGSGRRDIARVLHIRPSTVMHELNKRACTATCACGRMS